ncbi:nucleotidyltransferase family protein [candidate division TA06 bacterium]|uniref:Nucleotidyltransferase family protein n=1 Tax=candidate division TA06 bacterium TaxID=2250710 RepID=A0A933I908_UNCT6|nr:nucleotidyltransferase family protein [candidate division TA06 bacterium]
MNNFITSAPVAEIAQFCQRWLISKLALFGSVLRDDFGPESDVDILVAFSPGADWGLLDHVQMQQELQTILRRNVDLISARALERSRNWMLRDEILNTAETLFPQRKAAHVSG